MTTPALEMPVNDLTDVSERPTPWRACAGLFRNQPLGAAGAVIMLMMVVVAIGAPWLAPFDPTDGNSAVLNTPPNTVYWLGTDAFGRDILSRLIHGARVSLLVGLGASLIGVMVGASLGIVTGYAGGEENDDAKN